jgi:hypothetical protein
MQNYKICKKKILAHLPEYTRMLAKVFFKETPTGALYCSNLVIYTDITKYYTNITKYARTNIGPPS